jgi:hypothetical protein
MRCERMDGDVDNYKINWTEIVIFRLVASLRYLFFTIIFCRAALLS